METVNVQPQYIGASFGLALNLKLVTWNF